MSDIVRYAIYGHLERKFSELNKGLTIKQQTELDSVLWDLSLALSHADAFRIDIKPNGTCWSRTTRRINVENV